MKPIKEVLITFPEHKPGFGPTEGYPLAVVCVFTDGTRSQETLVRSIREGRIYGNGMIVGFLIMSEGQRGMDEKLYPVNVTLDPALDDEKS